ncbi:MAG: DUF5050 domain-containing protein, partial [Lachnospiraceae bacterium]|nr:DUF5050 domain-containing protein [Lachnospiraceae bacterium]
NPATGMTTPVAPTPVAPVPEAVAQPVAPVAPAPEVMVQPVAPAAPAPEVMAQPVAPAAPAPEVMAQPVAPAAPAPEVMAQPVAPAAPAPEVMAQPVAPAAPAPEMYGQPVAPAPAAYGQPVAPVAPAPAPAAEAPKEKKPVNKAIFFIIGGVAALIIVGIIIAAVVLSGKSGGSTYTAEWNRFYDTEDEVTHFVYGDTVLKDTVPSTAYFCGYSMDETVAIAYNEDGDDSEYYMITSKGKITSLGEDLYDVVISQDGSTIAYIDEDDTLFTYQVSNGSKTKIAEDVVTVVLSPSGKALAYVVDDDDDYKMYVYSNKKETELSKNADPIGLTDDCKYIYYYDDHKNALYVTNLKDDSNKIDSDCDGTFVFNKDHTQLMYTTDNGLFVTVKGGDKQKVSSKSYLPVYIGIYANQYAYLDNNGGAYTFNIASLNNQYYVLGDSLIFVDKKWSSDKVINNVDDIEFSKDLKTVYYTNDNGTLYTCKLDGKYDSTKIKSDVTSFSMTNDGTSVYYIVDNDSLYYQKAKGDSTKIASDCRSVSVSNDGIAFFMLDYDSEDETGVLYYSKGGKDKQKVASDVYSYYCDVNTVIYYDNYEYESNYDEDTWVYSYSMTYDVNIAKGGTKFTKILENIGYAYKG